MREPVQAKAEGREVMSVESPPQATNVVDLVEAFQGSLERQQTGTRRQK
ncbi:hypothetical protein ACH4PR_49335 [Streptomyces mirabilis]